MINIKTTHYTSNKDPLYTSIFIKNPLENTDSLEALEEDYQHPDDRFKDSKLIVQNGNTLLDNVGFTICRFIHCIYNFLIHCLTQCWKLN